MSDTGDLELDAEGDPKGSNSQAVRKNISIKLKASPKGRGKGRRGSAKKKPAKKVVEQDDPMEPDPEDDDDIGSSAIPTTKFTISDEPVHKSKPLRWDHKVLMLGEKVVDPTMYCCERCGLPILVYGRMLPCKHVFCFDCARKNDKSCPRCNDPVQRVEQSALGTVYVCTYGASKHDPTGCRRTYLSQRDLQAHVMHRHSKHPESQTRALKASPVGQTQSQTMKALPAVSQVSTSTTRDPFPMGRTAVPPLSASVTSGSNMPVAAGKPMTFDASSMYHQRHTAPPVMAGHVPPPTHPMPVVSQPPPPLPMQSHAPMQSHGHGPLQSHPPLQSHTSILALPPTNQPPPQLPPMNQPPPIQNPSNQAIPMQTQPPPQSHPTGLSGTAIRQPHPGGQGHMETYHTMQPVVPRTNLITVPIQDEGDYRKHDQGTYPHGGPPSGSYQSQQHFPPTASHPNVSMTAPVSYSGPPPMFSMPPPHTAGPNLRSPLSQPPPRGPGGPPVSSHGGMPPQGPPRFNAPHHFDERPHTPPYNQQGGHSPRPWGAGPPRGPPRGPAPRGNYY